ncbi:hypothetical protein [Paenarthrobacter ureafaciens]|nr:hypothetical protein [Paenarthrobacter ureafaciens]MEC3854244.1 hypothetical protein [Paenarthrobacter ureafaciens]
MPPLPQGTTIRATRADRSTRPYLSNAVVVILCMLVTVMEGYT